MDNLISGGVDNISVFVQQLIAFGTTYGLKLVGALLIFFIGRWAAGLAANLADKYMLKANLDKTVVTFLHNVIYSVLIAFVIIAALSKVGIQTASFVAVLGAAGLAIGLALQGSLSNFAAGVLMIIFRPFKEGDFVEAGGVSGIVEKIMVFSTQFRTPDNKRVILPNSAVTGGSIVNYSANPTRRIDMTIGVSYDADLKQVRQVLSDAIATDDRILLDQDVTIAVAELADSSVNFAVRFWVQTGDYWPVYFDMLESIKIALDANNIGIPYPQLDLHMDPVKMAEAQAVN